MQFRDVKQNYTVYLFDKQELKLMTGKVTAASNFPRMATNPTTGKSEMVMDFTIAVGDDKPVNYSMPENLSVSYAGNLIIAADNKGMSAEIETLLNQANQALASMDYYQKFKDSAPNYLAELNPEYRAKQETEKRFVALEGSMSEMKNLMKQQQEMMIKQQEMMAKFLNKS